MLNETNIKINGGGTCAVLRLITIRGPLSYGYIQPETLLNHHNVIIILSYFVAVSVTEDRGKMISIKKGVGDLEISTVHRTPLFSIFFNV